MNTLDMALQTHLMLTLYTLMTLQSHLMLTLLYPDDTTVVMGQFQVIADIEYFNWSHDSQ